MYTIYKITYDVYYVYVFIYNFIYLNFSHLTTSLNYYMSTKPKCSLQNMPNMQNMVFRVHIWARQI